MRRNRYKNLTSDDIILANEFQKNEKWDFYNEREFTENLLQTRFNFLIATYAIFIGTLFSVKEDSIKIVISFFGLILFILLFNTIYRLYKKTEILLKIFRDLDPKHLHVANIIDKELYGSAAFSIHKNQDLEKCKGVNIIIGVIIPVFMIITFVIFFGYYFFVKSGFYLNIGFKYLCK